MMNILDGKTVVISLTQNSGVDCARFFIRLINHQCGIQTLITGGEAMIRVQLTSGVENRIISQIGGDLDE